MLSIYVDSNEGKIRANPEQSGPIFATVDQLRQIRVNHGQLMLLGPLGATCYQLGANRRQLGSIKVNQCQSGPIESN